MIGLMLPSYQRVAELERVLRHTPLDRGTRFFVVANVPSADYSRLSRRFADRATFIDERAFGRLGGCRAYNLAYEQAINHGCDYVVHYADDILPFDRNWLTRLRREFIAPGHVFGVFSSDECHYGHFGWNIVQDVPIAHFYIARCGLLGAPLFDARYRQHIIDYEISVRALAAGHEIRLLPIRLRHYRCQLHRAEGSKNYEIDEALFYRLNPAFRDCLRRPEAKRYIPESGRGLTLPTARLDARLRPWPEPPKRRTRKPRKVATRTRSAAA